MTDKITNNPVIREIQSVLANDAKIDAAEGEKIQELLNKATPEERSEALQFLDKKCATAPAICSLFKGDLETWKKDREVAEAAFSEIRSLLAEPLLPDYGAFFDSSGGQEGNPMENAGGVDGLGTRGVGAQGGSGLGIGGVGLYGTAGRKREPIDLGGRGKGVTRILGSDETTIRGGLSKDVIGRLIRRHWAQTKYAYEKALDRNPNLEGKVISKFAINPDGKVTDVELESDTIKDPQMLDEIKGVLEQIRFPKPEGGGFVDVTYPFVFTLRR